MTSILKIISFLIFALMIIASLLQFEDQIKAQDEVKSLIHDREFESALKSMSVYMKGEQIIVTAQPTIIEYFLSVEPKMPYTIQTEIQLEEYMVKNNISDILTMDRMSSISSAQFKQVFGNISNDKNPNYIEVTNISTEFNTIHLYRLHFGET